MTRIEELTNRLLEGDLDETGQEELERLVGSDPEARRLHLGLLEVEAGLRGARRRIDAVPRVMERLQRDREARLVEGVMSRIRGRGRATARPWRGWAWGALVAAACVALAVGAVLRARSGGDGGTAGVPAVTPLARAAEVTGRATLARGGERVPLVPGAELRPGDRVETGPDAEVTLRYQERSRLALGPAAAIAFPSRTGERIRSLEARVVRLERGRLAADLAPLPVGEVLVFATPHARAIVVGTRLVLEVSTAATRLDVLEGRVVFEDLRAGSVREVVGGQQALTAEETAARGPAGPPRADDGGLAGELPAVTVLSFDFEDGVLPAVFTSGVLAPGPPRDGNRYALMGTLDFYGPETNTVAVGPGRDLFRYSDTLVLAFDYWVGSDAKGLWIQVWNADRGQNFSLELRDLVREGWGRAEVRLADMRGNRRKHERMEPGDRLGNIMILGGRMAGRPLFVDNVRVIDYPAAQLP